MTALIRACAPSPPLCLFILALSPPGSWNQLPHLPSQSLRHMPLAPPSSLLTTKETRLTFCARLTIKPSSSARFWPSGDLLSQTILARSFLRETTVPLLFGRLQHGLTFGRLPSQPSNFSLSVYLCYVPAVIYGYSLLWERLVLCFRTVSVSMRYLLLHVFIW